MRAWTTLFFVTTSLLVIGPSQGPARAGAPEAVADSAGAPPESADPVLVMTRLAARLQADNRSLELRIAELEKTLAESPAGPDSAADPLDVVRQDDEATRARLDLMPDITGYFDFEYVNDNLPGSPGSFRQHRLSIIPSKEYESFRVLGEIEFEYGPRFDGDGEGEVRAARGQIVMEQGWVEYSPSDLLTSRGGLILTPGIWNINHYANVVLPTRRPLMVTKVFPLNFTGVMAYGSAYRSVIGCTYEAYVANGQSGNHPKRDDNEHKAAGGRLVLHLPLGQFEKIDLSSQILVDHPNGQRESHTWGFETEIARGPVRVLSEFAHRTGSSPQEGFYAQPSLRFNERYAVFYRYDRLESTSADRQEEHTVGFNFRPIPKVALKVETYRANPPAAESYDGLAASIAIAL